MLRVFELLDLQIFLETAKKKKKPVFKDKSELEAWYLHETI